MEKRGKKHEGSPSSYSSSSSSSSSTCLDHLFGPRDSSSSSSTSTGLFGTIFPPPSTVLARNQDFAAHKGNAKFRTTDDITGRSKGEGKEYRNSMYQNETIEPSYLSSSIYYGGQENYSPRTTPNHDHPQTFRRDGGDFDDPNGGASNEASRGNWWQGSLYY